MEYRKLGIRNIFTENLTSKVKTIRPDGFTKESKANSI